MRDRLLGVVVGGVTGVVSAVATLDYSDPVVMCNEAGGPVINQRDQSDNSFRQ